AVDAGTWVPALPRRGGRRPGGDRLDPRPVPRGGRTGAARSVIEARGLLLDIDGVLTVSWEPIRGAPEALAALRVAGVPLALITNTTTTSRAEIASHLRRAGIDVADDEILTAPMATAAYVRRRHPGARCYLLGVDGAATDMTGVEFVGPAPRSADVVIV